MPSLSEPSKMLDRGGHPTVRQLLSGLVFNPNDGTIKLNGARIVMQRASALSDLRRELVRILGEREARVLLLRLGFMSGRADARFVRSGWPNLDTGDAFTAGTRLHTFSGVVRVETVFNSYDFRKKRFSAEFLWHDSVEAAEFSKTRVASEPVCWTQLGYASGYATEFFDTLIVYKELECAAQGHSHCRVIGKPAETWGAGDPDVVLFRERIDVAAEAQPGPLNHARGQEVQLSDLERLVLRPVRHTLDRLAAMAVPVLIAGASGTGRNSAARYLHRASGAPGKLRRFAGIQVDLAVCAEIAQPEKKRRHAIPRETVLIDAVETIPAELQQHFVRAVEEGMATGGPRLLAIAAPDAGAEGTGLSPELFSLLSSLVVEMPRLATRDGERAALAQALIPVLSSRMGLEPPFLEKEAEALIEALPWPGNLRQMRSVLAAAIAAAPVGAPLSGPEIEVQLARLSPRIKTDAALDMDQPMVDRLLEREGFSFAGLESSIYTTAIKRAGGNLSAAARMLGLTRPQFAYRLNNVKPRRNGGE